MSKGVRPKGALSKSQDLPTTVCVCVYDFSNMTSSNLTLNRYSHIKQNEQVGQMTHFLWTGGTNDAFLLQCLKMPGWTYVILQPEVRQTSFFSFMWDKHWVIQMSPFQQSQTNIDTNVRWTNIKGSTINQLISFFHDIFIIISIGDYFSPLHPP